MCVCFGVDDFDVCMLHGVVTGLPTTTEGFNGLLVITEYLTKYPYAVPIKSKTADEIAEKLLVYISLFGPPKTILSDQGTEFNNAVVAKLVKATGVERRITSAYHPRTNGQTERFNYTFIEALRKYTSEDNENWPKWVPFVLMAFRTRVHSTTGYTPFELMFGRKMNTFSDWRDSDEPPGDINELRNRAVEIKDLIENDHPSARANIEKSQEAQRKSQNTQHRITMDLVPIGTKVYISTTGMHNKLYPKYRGPYTVVEYTPGGNYIVANQLNERLQDSFPLQRLKVIKDAVSSATEVQSKAAEYARVEKIIKAQQDESGDYVYLVKFRDCPSSENEWLRKEDFTDMDMINDFWKLEKGLKVKRGRGRPPKIRVANLIYICAFIFFLLQGISGLRIEDDFYFCSGNHETLWTTPYLDIENGCKITKDAQRKTGNYLIEGAEYTTTVLAKAVHQINRVGWECRKLMYVVMATENFFGAKETIINKTSIDLTPAACWRMAEEKSCEGLPMICEGPTCTHNPDLTAEHRWLTTNRRTDYSCVLTRKPIIAKSLDSKLFGLDCRVKDLSCKSKHVTTVWADAQNECSLRRVPLGRKFISQGNDLLVQNDTNIAVALINKTTECGLDVFTTREGLYVSFDPEARKLNESDEVNIAALHELMLAEADGDKFATAKQFSNIQKQMCENFAVFLRELRKEDNRYDIFVGIDGKARVLYSKNGLIFLPKCVKMNSIVIVENATQCYIDLLVYAHSGNTTMRGFLKENNIIITTSQEVDCKSKIIYQNLQTLNALVVRNKDGKIEIRNDVHKISLASLQETFQEINFPHNRGLFNNVDLLNEIVQLNFAVKTEEEKKTHEIFQTGNFTSFVGIRFPHVSEGFSTAVSSVISVFTEIKTIVILIIILVIIIGICFALRYYFQYKRGEQRTNMFRVKFRRVARKDSEDDNAYENASAPELRVDPVTAALINSALNKKS